MIRLSSDRAGVRRMWIVGFSVWLLAGAIFASEWALGVIAGQEPPTQQRIVPVRAVPVNADEWYRWAEQEVKNDQTRMRAAEASG